MGSENGSIRKGTAYQTSHHAALSEYCLRIVQQALPRHDNDLFHRQMDFQKLLMRAKRRFISAETDQSEVYCRVGWILDDIRAPLSQGASKRWLSFHLLGNDLKTSRDNERYGVGVWYCGG